MHADQPRPSYGALFAIPSMKRILLGMALSRTGSSMLGVAIVLFTLDRFKSPGLAGLVTFAGTAPGLFVSPIVGALLDRHGRARLIIADQLTATAALSLIAVLAITGTLTPPILLLVSAVAGLTAPLSNVGLRTLLPLIVPRYLWIRVNAVDSNGYVVATLIGPPAAGLLVQVIGAPGALLAVAALHAISAVVIIGVPEPRSAVVSTGRLLVDAWAGLRYTIGNPTLRGLGVSISVLNLASGIITIVLPVVLLQHLGLGEAVVGAVWAAAGITGGISALVVGRWHIAGHERTVISLGMLGFAMAALALGLSPTLPVIIGAIAFQGLMNGPMDVAMFTVRQLRTDPAWLGRAFAVSMSLNFLGYPFGAALGGILVGFGVEAAIGVAVGVTLVGAVCAATMIPSNGPTFGSAVPPDPLPAANPRGPNPQGPD